MMTSLLNLMILAQTQTPVPHDIPLPLPAERGVIVGILIVMFLVHILFVNLMLGGTLLTAFFQGRSILKGTHDDDLLAYEIAKTVTVNKSMAVVMGVAPLLGINLIYTVYFYSANALTGYAWISIVPLVTTAFLLLYLHKYTWHTQYMQNHRKLHHGIILLALAILLCIPFIFLTNINLMLFPDKWPQVRGFFSAMFINANVIPRFLHFFIASLAITGLFMVWLVGRPSLDVEGQFTQTTRAGLKRRFYKLATICTLTQLVVGPLVFITLPRIGWSVGFYIVLGIGITFALISLTLMAREINAHDDQIGRSFKPIVLLLSVTVLCMGTGRHMYREKALVGHMIDMQTKTAAYVTVRDAAYAQKQLDDAAGGIALDGKALFNTICATCHAMNKVLAAPPLTEVGSIYKDNPQGIVAWAKNPGRKRVKQFAPMPTMAHLGDQKLAAIAQYILKATGNLSATKEAGQPTDATPAPAPTPTDAPAP